MHIRATASLEGTDASDERTGRVSHRGTHAPNPDKSAISDWRRTLVRSRLDAACQCPSSVVCQGATLVDSLGVGVWLVAACSSGWGCWYAGVNCEGMCYKYASFVRRRRRVVPPCYPLSRPPTPTLPTP